MPSRALPGIGLTGFWDLGEDNWKAAMDANLLALSALVQARVLSIVNATPAAPAQGEIHFFGPTHPAQPNKLAIYDNGAWLYIAAFEGLELYNLGDDKAYRFNGALLVEIVAGAVGGGGGEAPAPFGSHKFWRARFMGTENPGAYPALATLHMRDALGGAKLIPTSIVASGGSLVGAPANLQDDDTATQWVAGNSSPQSVSYEFAAPVGVRQFMMQRSGYSGETPNAIDWLYSDDGVNYTLAFSSNPINIAASADILVNCPTTTGDELAVENQIGADYAVTINDSGKYIRRDNAAANTFTIPAAAAVNFPTGTQLNVVQAGVGQTTVVAAAGVTINSPATLKLRTRYSSATLVKVGANTWDITGDLAAA